MVLARFSSIGSILLVLVALPLCAAAAGSQGYDTVFAHEERSWATGEIVLEKPLHFRDGKLLAYPGKITEVLYAKRGQPRNILLVYEPAAGAPEVFHPGVPFVAALEVLSKHKYWRDNLPTIPRHGVLGGVRNVFAGKDLEPAKKVLAAYGAALKEKMPRRNELKAAALVDALFSGVDRLRQDAAEHIRQGHVGSHYFTEPSQKRLAEFVTGDSDEGDRGRIVEAAGKYKLEFLAPALEKLASGDGPLAAKALAALTAMGKPRSGPQLEKLSTSKAVGVRAFALAALAETAPRGDSLERCRAELAGDDDVEVRRAVAEGLGRSGAKEAVPMLNDALLRGDEASRAAADALAAIGSDEAIDALKHAVREGPSEAAIGSVVAISRVRNCDDCVAFMAEQYKSHPDEGIRKLIALVVGKDAPHVH